MIVLLGNYDFDRQESMQRFAHTLREALEVKGVPVSLVSPPAIFGRLKPGAHGLGKWLGYFDKFIVFPILLRQKVARLDPAARAQLLVHICDHSSAHYTRYLHRIPHLVTCHDVLALRSARGDFPENPTSWTGRQYQRLILKGLQRACHLACVSEATQVELTEITELPLEQTTVVENGLNFPYAPMPAAEATGIIQEAFTRKGLTLRSDAPFLFHIGGNQWYKNRAGLLQIQLELCRRDPNTPPLVIAGQDSPAELSALIPAPFSDKFLEVGKLTNRELQAFYSSARLLLFPSKHEGFGWPIIEAQACGCPVATSNRAPMNQIGGTAAATFDPENIRAATDAVQKLLGETPLARRERIQEGLTNAARFSTDRMVEAYLDLYQQLSLGSIFSHAHSPRH